MRKSALIVALVLASYAALTSVAAVAQQSGEAPRRTISVSGVGLLTAKPDLAEISVGVATDAPQAQAALAANNTAMAALMAVLKGAAIEDRDIETRNFNVSPVYEQRPGRSDGSTRVAGYRVQNDVTVRVRDLPKLGGLLDKLIGEGANRVNGIRFALADSRKLETEARAAAVIDARRKAETYANAAGVQLGDVLAINEQGVAPPQPMRMGAMERMVASDVPIASGELEIRTSVTVVYAIAR